jgi:hypothetical protein
MFRQFSRGFILIVGVTPSVLGLLIAGTMMGRPAPCGDPPACTPRTFGAETLVLPFGTVVSLLCGLAFANLGRTAPQKSAQISGLNRENAA